VYIHAYTQILVLSQQMREQSAAMSSQQQEEKEQEREDRMCYGIPSLVTRRRRRIHFLDNLNKNTKH